MQRLSDRMERICPSATMAMTRKATELREQGVPVIGFSAGEPDFDTPGHILEAAHRALAEGATRYTPVGGTSSLRAAVARQSERVRGVSCRPEQVIIGCGAKHVLYNYFMAVLRPGDEVIIPAPYWVSYPDQVRLAGGIPVIAPTRPEEDWILTAEGLERHLTPKTRVVLLNSPSNPTGSVYSRSALGAVVQNALDRGLWVLVDEIYRDLVYDDTICTSALSVAHRNAERIFTVDGVSKSCAMTGFRIGWGIGDPDVVRAMESIQGQSTSNPNAMAQVAAVTAVSEPMTFLDDWRHQFEKRRNHLVHGLNAMKGVTCRMPQGAFYVLPDVTKILPLLGENTADTAFCLWLLETARVATVPGSAFGAPGTIRLSYALSMPDLDEGLSRMAEAIEGLG